MAAYVHRAALSLDQVDGAMMRLFGHKLLSEGYEDLCPWAYCSSSICRKAFMHLHQQHLSVLRAAPFSPNGPGGVMPTSWADSALNIWSGWNPPLPQVRLCRAALRTYCQDPATPPFHAFVAIMAWGNQVARSAKFRTAVMQNRADIEHALNDLRKGLAPAVAYDRWRGMLWGLGPSFFTKIIAFMSPAENVAIMDQWAVKALHLLYGTKMVHLSPPSGNGRMASPMAKNRGHHYADYCDHLAHLGQILGVATVSGVEERIFCRPSGPWRAYVHQHWQP